MGISPELNDILNVQILHEYRNQLAYTQIESIFEDFQLKNIAKYFREQSDHEKSHGDKIVQYLNSRTGGKVVIKGIDDPLVLDYPGAETLPLIGNLYVRLEEQTTASLEGIYNFALSIASYVDLPFLLEMLKEQVEEEDKAKEFSTNIQMVKDLVLFDKTFGG